MHRIINLIYLSPRDSGRYDNNGTLPNEWLDGNAVKRTSLLNSSLFVPKNEETALIKKNSSHQGLFHPVRFQKGLSFPGEILPKGFRRVVWLEPWNHDPIPD